MTDSSVDPIYSETLTKMIELETFLKQKVYQNAKEWTQKTMRGPDMVDMIWSPMLKYPLKADKSDKDYTRSPSINIKIPCWDGKWTPEVYDADGICKFSEHQHIGESPIPLFSKGTNVIAIIQCGGLWVVSGKIGVTWKLIQAVVKQADTSIVGRCLITLPETKKQEFKSSVPPEDLEDATVRTDEDGASDVEREHRSSIGSGEDEVEQEEDLFASTKSRGKGKR